MPDRTDEIGRPEVPRGDARAVEVAIVGAGFSGLGTAIRLALGGQRDFVILEQADAVGGTWRANHYPGCACDVPSHLYSYSFAPNPGWSSAYAGHAEIRAYLERCVDRFALRSHLRLGVEVIRATFDEGAGRWALEARDGQRFSARHLVLGMGALSRPAMPEVAGLETFRGRVFHSADWDHQHPLGDDRVAVIGTGASAIQFIPHVAEAAAHLTVFQRTPPWVLPRNDPPYSEAERARFAERPARRLLHRAGIYWRHEAAALAFVVEPRLMALARRWATAHLTAQVADPRLRDALTPTYRPGCKRLLLSNDYYPALTQPHVALVTAPIERVTEAGVLTRDGQLHAVDTIICGTGFRVTDVLSPLTVTGLGGRDLNTDWRAGIEAYLGTMISGYPNLYMMMGPNTGLGHSSMVFMIEAQIRMALRVMGATRARGADWADVTPSAQRRFNDDLSQRLTRTVWATGCSSWYLQDGGRNATLWPGFTLEYWLKTRRISLGALRFGRRRDHEAAERSASGHHGRGQRPRAGAGA
jgi:cation diffusion facilitator CzcD-associated flavoprotein CzcO